MSISLGMGFMAGLRGRAGGGRGKLEGEEVDGRR